VNGNQIPRSFVETASVSELRQGDICFEWPFPKWQLNGYSVAADPSGGNPNVALVGLYEQGARLPLVICSHDCDLENWRARLGFVVAPVFDWPFPDMGSDESLALIGSAVLGEDGSYDYINLFPLKFSGEPINWRVVDFSGLTSIASPRKATPVLLKAKRFEMTEETRLNFGNKLAAFFIRSVEAEAKPGAEAVGARPVGAEAAGGA
jgi:hypothetical protein